MAEREEREGRGDFYHRQQWLLTLFDTQFIYFFDEGEGGISVWEKGGKKEGATERGKKSAERKGEEGRSREKTKCIAGNEDLFLCRVNSKSS